MFKYLCKNGNAILSYIPFPRWENGTNKGSVKWSQTVGMTFKLSFNEGEYDVKIIGYDSSKKRMYVNCDGYIKENGIATSHFASGSFGGILNINPNTLIDAKWVYVCSNNVKILTELPYKRGNVDYSSMVGMCFDVEYFGQTYHNISIVEYNNDNQLQTKFITEYNGYKKEILCSNLLKGKFGCVLNVIKRDYKYSIGDIINNLEIISQGYKYNCNGHKAKAYQFKCKLCGFNCGKHYSIFNDEYRDEYWITEEHLKSNRGCPCCANPPKIVVEGINDMFTTDHWMVELGVDEEFAKTHTNGTTDLVPCKCPICGEINMKHCNNIDKNKSNYCKYCSDGFQYPEKFMCSILNQMNIHFETQYIKDWSKNKLYDFYLNVNNEKYIIETHGRQHYEDGWDKLIKTQDNDKYKKELALNNGIEDDNYIVIDCRYSDMDFIKNNIFNSTLAKLFDLNKIDWDKANEYAWKSNLKKEVCDYWNNKEENETTTDLAQVFNISTTSIGTYLKKGTELGWCKYDANTESILKAKRIGKNNNKPIEIFKDGIVLGLFESASELERQSEKIFGVKLTNSGISQACSGKIKIYKGYTFKYTTL